MQNANVNRKYGESVEVSEKLGKMMWDIDLSEFGPNELRNLSGMTIAQAQVARQLRRELSARYSGVPLGRMMMQAASHWSYKDT